MLVARRRLRLFIVAVPIFGLQKRILAAAAVVAVLHIEMDTQLRPVHLIQLL